jgi:hypothetical protein
MMYHITSFPAPSRRALKFDLHLLSKKKKWTNNADSSFMSLGRLFGSLKAERYPS